MLIAVFEIRLAGVYRQTPLCHLLPTFHLVNNHRGQYPGPLPSHQPWGSQQSHLERVPSWARNSPPGSLSGIASRRQARMRVPSSLTSMMAPKLSISAMIYNRVAEPRLVAMLYIDALPFCLVLSEHFHFASHKHIAGHSSCSYFLPALITGSPPGISTCLFCRWHPVDQNAFRYTIIRHCDRRCWPCGTASLGISFKMGLQSPTHRQPPSPNGNRTCRWHSATIT